MADFAGEKTQRADRAVDAIAVSVRQPWERPELECIDFEPEGLGGNTGDGIDNLC
jgi:hypothetical protein